MIDSDNILYNTFTCLDLNEELQKSMNELIIYVTETYIDYIVKGNEPKCSALEEDNEADIVKLYFQYAFKLMFSGVFPDTYHIMMQSYYESEIRSLSLANDKNIEAIRLQMLFVLYGSKLLHSGKIEEFLEVANQFSSNRIFDINYYKNILLG